MASVREELPKLMWKPQPDRAINIQRFKSFVNHAYDIHLGLYTALKSQ